MNHLKDYLGGLKFVLVALCCLSWGHGGWAQTAASEDAGGWLQLPGSAIDVSINSEGQAYVIGSDGTPWRWDAVEQRWRRMSGTYVRITAAQGNRPWAVNGDGVVYRYNGLWWEDKDTEVSDVAADALGNVYIAKLDGTIHKWNPLRSEWGTVPGRAKRLALDETGYPWAVTSDGRIRSFDGENWTDYPGRAQDIAIGGNGAVVIADGDGRVRVLNAERRQWVLVAGVANVTGVAATPNGRPWAVVTGGRIMAMARLVSPEKISKEKGRAEEIHAPGAQAPVETAEVPVAPRAQADTPALSSPAAPSPQAPGANAKVDTATTPQAQPGTTQQSVNNQTGGAEMPTVGMNLVGGDQATATYSGKITFIDTRKTAASLAIGADGSVFGLDAGGNVLRWSNAKERFESFPGTLVRIAVDKDGNPWGISALGRVFRHDGARWLQIPNATASDIAIGFDGTVLTANASGQLYKLNDAGTAFAQIKGTGTSVAVGPDGTPWTIRADNLIQRCDVFPCKVLSQKANSLSVGPDGSVWIVSDGNQLKRLKNDGASFEAIQTPGHTPSKVAVGPSGYPWVVSADKVALASAFFERDETADTTVASSTSGDTTGTGATSAVTSSSTTSFTFTKNMRFETVSVDSANALSPGAKAMLESDLDGRVWAYNNGSKFLYYDSDRRKFVAANNTTIDTYGLADFAVAPDNVYWGYKSEGKLYRDKNGVAKQYFPTTEAGANNFNGVEVGPDGTVYVSVYFVGAKYYLYTKAPNSEAFKKFSTQQVRDIAVGPGSDIWIIGENAKVMHWTGTKFEEPSSTTFYASEISISKVDGTVYVNKFSSYDLYKWNATNKTFDAVSNTAAQYFAVDADGRPWICNDNTPVIKRAR